MGYALREDEIKWISDHYPGLRYDRVNQVLLGDFSFSAKYRDLEQITDRYDIVVYFGRMRAIDIIPDVYEISGKIQKFARLLNKPIIDLHCYSDVRLCMIRPDKKRSWYHNRFDIKTFMEHLTTHFYWVSYVARYGKEPWPGEKHGWDDSKT